MNQRISRLLVSLLAGLLFGAGLAVSGMVNPQRVIGFLDITGQWDPTLALVMGGALMVTFPAFPWVLRHARPWFAERFELPTRVKVDPSLIAGASLFGAGWGLGGFCPGPGIAALATGSVDVLVFVLCMLGGMLLLKFAGR